ncbi:protein-glutamate O-methyltransferase CheR [Clostridium sp. DJ247]|uniref:CheR family methyltransferase n=1 Tax=Clostridium sp. DJ247 TaxID=2726188 RepID=UPI001628A576|nr:protein-glutamate O-methyltransferase CheR [Clostridium sp. DJ247]MBC2581451.1 tetratricopeptide repeat protein [Clostridium sp. DJ247]
MNKNIPKDVLQCLNKFVEAKFGLYFQEERFIDLIRGLIKASKEKNVHIEEYINLILSNRLSSEEFKTLITCLTIGETYFFRDKKLFEIIRKKILPELIDKRKYSSRSLKIWSAGCSSGEEAYSIAILIKELIHDYEAWNIKIVATDINEIFLNKARNAVYTDWSFRGVDLSFKNKYFKKIDNIHYKLKDDVVKLVEFHNLNLADNNCISVDYINNDVDIIFCRNVLMYFNKHRAQEIIKGFYNIITDGGWLISAPTESLYLNDTAFVPVNINGTFLYCKNNKKDNLAELPSKDFILKDYMSIKSEKLENSIGLIKNNNIILEMPEVKAIDISVPKDLSKKHKPNSNDYETLARSYANEGKLEEALKWCEQAICQDKISSRLYHLLASIQQELGNIDEAVLSLKKAIYLDSDFIIAYFDLGNLYLKQEKLKEAFKNFQTTGELLNRFNEEETIPYSENITVGMLKQIIKNIVYR